ncbi:hypothetical protein [Magnetospirillum gryphiswaldense]|uniref:hypothetical protein n=1 Tax=Magnetospirillum gryphiswaldense TaxID=55518 RepID=UPI0018F87493|nr:hypothetical protein [Magnetospirillum gryphiswaldense]
MWKSLLRAVGLDRRRSFDAAGGGRRWDGARTVDGINSSIQAGATTAARRAGWYARNNPWVSAAEQSLAANAVRRQWPARRLSLHCKPPRRCPSALNQSEDSQRV